MTTIASGDLLDQKIDICFAHADIDKDGVIDASDILALAARVIAAAGVPFDSPEAIALLRSSDAWWQALIREFDVNTDGRVRKDEYRAALRRMAGREDAVERVLLPGAEALWQLMDRNDDGEISPTEFSAFQRAFGSSPEVTRIAFEKLDTNGDGVLSRDEIIASFLGFFTSTDPAAYGNRLFGDALS
jgi:Ca2+-binding EF-hand superfamily protein